MARDVGGASRLYLKTLFEEGTAAALTDGQLLERFATGQGEAAERAFAILVERHGSMVLRACRGILRDDHEAMDAFQATFLVLVRKGHSLWVRDSLGPWLHRVACRAAKRATADAGRRRALEQRVAEALRDRASGKDRDDLAAAVHEEVDRLPERYRVPIVLCDLEGRTCEEAARHLGCPIGTIGSRLARGRDRLRGRLVHRGLAPTVGALIAALATDSRGAGMSPALAESTAQLGRCLTLGKTGAGMSSAASAKLAEDVLRSLVMIKLSSIGAAALTVVGVGLVAAWTFRSSVGASPSLVAAQDKPPAKAAEEFPFLNDKERVKDALYVEIGNMRPLIQDAKGVRFQSRQAVLYKDGTAKLWSLEQKDPVAPPLRQGGPIRELTFFDEASLLVTMSDESIKLWNALNGEPRKELNAQAIRPLWLSFAPEAHRFITIDSGHRVVTVWDAVSLEAVATLRAEAVVAAGLSGDGKTVVTFRFGPEPFAELWDVASGRLFATLRPPSPIAAEVFAGEGKGLNKSKVDRGARFWEVVRSLAPTAAERKE